MFFWHHRPSMHFTVEMEISGSLAFLDVQLTRKCESDGSLSTSIYKKTYTHIKISIISFPLLFFTKKLVMLLFCTKSKEIINKDSDKILEVNKIKETLHNPMCSNEFPFKTTRNTKSSNNCIAFASIPYCERSFWAYQTVFGSSWHRSCKETAFYVVVCFR